MSKMRYPDAVWDLPELRFPGHPYAEESQRRKSLGPDGPRCPYVNSKVLLHRRRHGGVTLFIIRASKSNPRPICSLMITWQDYYVSSQQQD